MDHAPLDSPHDKYITTSDEALIVVMFENCSKCYSYVAQCKQDSVNVDHTNPNYQPCWSVSAAGQNKFGGWDDDGRVRFVELRHKIGAAKQKEHILDLETAISKEIQDKHSKTRPRQKKKRARPLKNGST